MLCDICMLLNGYFTSSAAAFLVSRQRPGCPQPPSSGMTTDLGHRPIDHSAGLYAHLMHRRRCPEPTPEVRKTSITSLSAIFSGLGLRYPSPDRGVCHRRPCVHRSLTRPAN